MKAKFPRNIILLGFISLLTDISSEMIYPMLPVLLVGILSASPLSLGLIEGIAESAGSIFKFLFGAYSDRFRKRKAFASSGYALSAAGKALLLFAGSWIGVLAARFTDRLGKGLRTAPRDALLAESADQESKGAAFGLHRAMDTAGAFIGILLAYLLLSWQNLELRTVILIALVPALASLPVFLFIKERAEHAGSGKRIDLMNILSWRSYPPELRKFIVITLIFGLGNSSNLFLLLKAYSGGMDPKTLVLLYGAYNLSSAAATYPFSRLSDRIGRRRLIALGYFIFAAVYLAFASFSGAGIFFGLFLVYGLYDALTSGIEKAYITDICDPGLKASALGLQAMAAGFVLFPASFIAGWLWTNVGASAPFYFSSVLGFSASILLLAWTKPHKLSSQP